MSDRRAITSLRAIVIAIGGVLVVAACGGRVDGGSPSLGSITLAPSPTTTGRVPGTGPGRPSGSTSSPAAAASEIADTYCRTFSSCCVGIGQPPIDTARCRELTSAVVAQAAARAGATLLEKDVAACVEGIRGRTATCGADDAKWWASSAVALFAPASIQLACEALLGPQPPTSGVECSAGVACVTGSCAIDECTAAVPVGGPCASDSRCLDGAVCNTGKCVLAPDAPVGAPCNADTDCGLGLLCFMGHCTEARARPELYKERHSPYRIGADTCRIYTRL